MYLLKCCQDWKRGGKCFSRAAKTWVSASVYVGIFRAQCKNRQLRNWQYLSQPKTEYFSRPKTNISARQKGSHSAKIFLPTERLLCRPNISRSTKKDSSFNLLWAMFWPQQSLLIAFHLNIPEVYRENTLLQSQGLQLSSCILVK